VNSAFSRPNWAQIDLGALKHNARLLAGLAAPANLVAVIKAGAYGHGAYHVANALKNEPYIKFFGVASVDEGSQLRALGVTTPILLLSAILPEEAEEVIRVDLTPNVFTLETATAVSKAAIAQGKTAAVHFKVDTGMGRLGVHYAEALQRYEEVATLPNLKIGGIFTHMASADEVEDDLTPLQIARFKQILQQLEARPAGRPDLLKHGANSATLLRYPEACFDLVRPGLALYGVHPCPELCPPVDLQPVMTWKSRITNIKTIRQGESVSYGAAWKAPRDSRIAVVPCGYADGYFRSLGNRGEVLIGEFSQQKRAKVVGRVTMDQILVDVSQISCKLGDEVTLFGANLPVEEVASLAGTISYELLCSVSARVPRVVIP
jgi:alanine racemase